MGDYVVSWKELTDEEAAALEASAPDFGDGFYDPNSLEQVGIYRLLADGMVIDQEGDPVQVKAGEFIHVLTDAEISRYSMDSWVYAAGEPLRVRLSGRVESILPNTLLAVMPEDWTPPK